MLVYKFSVGLFDKDTKQQRVTYRRAESVIAGICLDCGAYGLSITRGRGVYRHDDGSLVFEPSLFVEIAGISKEQAESIALQMKKILNQESIMVEERESVINFI